MGKMFKIQRLFMSTIITSIVQITILCCTNKMCDVKKNFKCMTNLETSFFFFNTHKAIQAKDTRVQKEH